MPCKKDYSNKILWIFPPHGDEEDYWCQNYRNIKIPRGWAFLPAGDSFTTRMVKAIGSHWLEVKAAKGYTRKFGIWAPEKNIDAAIKLAQETQEQRQNKRIVSRKQREKQETRYRDQFAEAVYTYLDFAPGYKKLARKISQETVERTTVVGSERVGRTKKLTLEDRAALAICTYIHHNHTKYDDNLASPELILDPHSHLYHEIRSEAEEKVDEFLDKHRKGKKPR